MGSLAICLVAASCTALSSFFFRKNGDNSAGTFNPSGYLVLFYLFSLIPSLLFCPEIWENRINVTIVSIGACVGLLNSTLMLFTSRALQQGPAGLTFAFQNASAIFPGLILFVLLGSDFGFSCSYLQLIGMSLALLGLFLGAKKESAPFLKASSKWLPYAVLCFVIQIAALTLIQARCLLFDSSNAAGIFSNFALTEADDIWFMPGQFGAALIMQSVIFFRQKKRFQPTEVLYGSLSGIANFSSTCLLLLATKLALPLEQSVLFPCFAVAALVLCSIWANRLYKEEFNLKTNVLCSCGIFLAVSS